MGKGIKESTPGKKKKTLSLPNSSYVLSDE